MKNHSPSSDDAAADSKNQQQQQAAAALAAASTSSSGGRSPATAAAASSSCAAQQQHHLHQHRHKNNVIAILPHHVIASIAAGEVIQRPVSVIKELLENSLDAQSTEVVVTICTGGGGGSGKNASSSASSISEMSISDNGMGMSPHDLPLAVFRHATSKLSSVDDLQRLDTFGFRGEALSSVSMVAAKLVICSRQAPQKGSLSSSSSSSSSAVAYTLAFRDGKPLGESPTPQPTARRVGTTVTVHDLFYNLPLRQGKSASNASSDYNAILHVMQAYSICVAERGIGLICQKTKSKEASKSSSSSSSSRSSKNMPSTTIDWNSSMGAVMAKLRTALQQHSSSSSSSSHSNNLHQELQHQATKHVIGMIHGSKIQAHLQHFAWTAPRQAAAASSKNDSAASISKDTPPFLYQCKGYLTLPSFYFQVKNNNNATTGSGGGNNKKTTASSNTTPANASMRLILFINQRLVECKPLTRAVEDAYTAFSTTSSGKQNKIPFLFLHLTIPPQEVDVNVHPSKKIVTLLHLNDVCQHVAAQFRHLLHQAGQSFCQSSSSSSSDPPPLTTTTANKTMSQSCLKPLQKQQHHHQQQQQQNDNKRPLARGEKVQVQNPYLPPKNKRQRSGNSSRNVDNSTSTTTATDEHEEKGIVPSRSKSKTRSSFSGDKQDDVSSSPVDATAPMTAAATAAPKPPRKKTPASQLIRTSRSSSQVGALEPFLVTKASLSQQSTTSTATTTTSTSPKLQQHEDGCPLSRRYNKENANDASSSPSCLSPMDLSQPGAFAILASQCQCFNRHLSSLSSTSPSPTNPATATINFNTMIRLPSQALVRPQAVVATQCEYKSIRKLRLEIQQQACPEIQPQLRSACFVGVVSRERSLLQVGQDLILLNHYEAAREMFYQLALLQFKGGARMANLGNIKTTNDGESHDDDKASGCQAGGIDIVTVIADLVENEDILGRLWHEDDDNVVKQTMATLMNTAGPLRNVSETNRTLAEQAAACLLEEAELLQEYFSIRVEREHDDKSKGRQDVHKGRIVLTGMPVLLQGYTPAPHGLSLFLLRLATEVNWKDERQCFHDICSELGAFYATLPLSSLPCGGAGDSCPADDVSHYLLPHVRHTIFPAISSLLVPSQSLQTNGHWKTLSKLTKLYKVFERC
jgi:DNA mismatch repair protein MutL